MRSFVAAILLLSSSVDGLRVPLAPRSDGVSYSTQRRGVLAGAAALVTLGPLAPPAMADTEPMLDKPMEGFGTDEEKRAAFKAKQKKYKKAWRKELSNLEFASNDAEAISAVDNLYGLLKENNFEVPEGVRKMDLDQVYKTVQPKLGKGARMNFQKVHPG